MQFLFNLDLLRKFVVPTKSAFISSACVNLLSYTINTKPIIKNGLTRFRRAWKAIDPTIEALKKLPKQHKTTQKRTVTNQLLLKKQNAIPWTPPKRCAHRLRSDSTPTTNKTSEQC